MCAVLPLLLIIIVQLSLDQITSYKLSSINRIVYAYADNAKQEGVFDYADLKDDIEKLGISQNDIICGTNERRYFRGELIPYYVKVVIRKPMLDLMLKNGSNYYNYVIDSCVASEYL